MGMEGDCAKQTDAIKALHDTVKDKATSWESSMTPVPGTVSKD